MFGHFTKSCLSTAAHVTEIKLDLTDDTAYWQKINALNASSQAFYICHVKEPKSKTKRRLYANLNMDGTDNYLWTRVNTAANVSLMPATVYTQIYEDPNLDGLGSMDINLSMYNDSDIHAFGTCTIPLILLIDGHTWDEFLCGQTPWQHVLPLWRFPLSQLLLACPAVAKQTPHNAHIISSEHDIAYINFISRKKHASYYQLAQSSTPLHLITHNNSIPHNVEEIKEKYSDIFEGFGTFLGSHTISYWTPVFHLCMYHADQCQSTNRRSLIVNSLTWKMPISSYVIV